MVYLSHALNIAILLFVCRAMFSNTKDVEAAFGPPSTARAILACVYFAIMSASMVALACAAWGAPQVTHHIAWVLFPLQIGYKTATAFAVGLRNPVVITNVVVALFHGITLGVLWRAI